jgi:hypothetical protein
MLGEKTICMRQITLTRLKGIDENPKPNAAGSYKIFVQLQNQENVLEIKILAGKCVDIRNEKSPK